MQKQGRAVRIGGVPLANMRNECKDGRLHNKKTGVATLPGRLIPACSLEPLKVEQKRSVRLEEKGQPLAVRFRKASSLPCAQVPMHIKSLRTMSSAASTRLEESSIPLELCITQFPRATSLRAVDDR